MLTMNSCWPVLSFRTVVLPSLLGHHLFQAALLVSRILFPIPSRLTVESVALT